MHEARAGSAAERGMRMQLNSFGEHLAERGDGFSVGGSARASGMLSDLLANLRGAFSAARGSASTTGLRAVAGCFPIFSHVSKPGFIGFSGFIGRGVCFRRTPSPVVSLGGVAR
jgi:hypothetical protein